MKDKLIHDVLVFASNYFIGDALTEIKRSKTQFHDLIAAANQATSVEQFKLYIAYKVAKDRRGGLWDNLGRKLNDFISKNVGSDREDKQEQIETLNRLRIGMGYLMWAAYAATQANNLPEVK